MDFLKIHRTVTYILAQDYTIYRCRLPVFTKKSKGCGLWICSLMSFSTIQGVPSEKNNGMEGARISWCYSLMVSRKNFAAKTKTMEDSMRWRLWFVCCYSHLIRGIHHLFSTATKKKNRICHILPYFTQILFPQSLDFSLGLRYAWLRVGYAELGPRGAGTALRGSGRFVQGGDSRGGEFSWERAGV